MIQKNSRSYSPFFNLLPNYGEKDFNKDLGNDVPVYDGDCGEDRNRTFYINI